LQDYNSKKYAGHVLYSDIIGKDEFGIVKESTSTEDIYQACKDEGQARYDQANYTPFMNTALLDAFGTLGNQEAIEQVLNGTFPCPSDTPPYTQKFIQELKWPDNLDNPGGITGYMTTASFTNSWKRMQVYTAASPFGPSFSEIITGTADPDIADADAALLSIATLAGVNHDHRCHDSQEEAFAPCHKTQNNCIIPCYV
jgi:hypothetical protein